MYDSVQKNSARPVSITHLSGSRPEGEGLLIPAENELRTPAMQPD
jgi:hypothetical protein